MDRRLTVLEAERSEVKRRFEQAWRCGDTAAEAAAVDELEQIDIRVKRVLSELERQDE